ncbi:MAG: DUF2071 domain-containing protein [Planctomycetota bacterium]
MSSSQQPAVRMSWIDLLFLHWPVDADRVRAILPAALEVDTFDGNAWIGLVPFTMTDCRFRGFGWVPGLANFYECNVRTYVRHGPHRGVWFFSLDAEHLLPVVGGRWIWNLNYVYSKFRVVQDGPRFDYRAKRKRGPWPSGEMHLAWTVGDERPLAQPDSLEHFLTERYLLFTQRSGLLYAGRIEHEPWPLRDAEVTRIDDSLVAAAGFEGLVNSEPIALASNRVDVLGYPLQKAAALDGIKP